MSGWLTAWSHKDPFLSRLPEYLELLPVPEPTAPACWVPLVMLRDSGPTQPRSMAALLHPLWRTGLWGLWTQEGRRAGAAGGKADGGTRGTYLLHQVKAQGSIFCMNCNKITVQKTMTEHSLRARHWVCCRCYYRVDSAYLLFLLHWPATTLPYLLGLQTRYVYTHLLC